MSKHENFLLMFFCLLLRRDKKFGIEFMRVNSMENLILLDSQKTKFVIILPIERREVWCCNRLRKVVF
ncbi:hypothetical protein PEDI_10340 [Persicobacter diffluens]|uniref:Uncharacterized protein n=1 Tax=Persicobacter diffluens TaxID=981 RepID=A0AAN4VX14_9BACT|nr:hypothetical protein PEDI_10340 [Persicobacter diffluens]